MHEDEHKVTITAAKCGREGCECGNLPKTYEGTVEDVLQKLNDESFERDEYILEVVYEQQKQIVTLMQIIELMATPGTSVQFVNVDDDLRDFGNGKLN